MDTEPGWSLEAYIEDDPSCMLFCDNGAVSAHTEFLNLVSQVLREALRLDKSEGAESLSVSCSLHVALHALASGLQLCSHCMPLPCSLKECTPHVSMASTHLGSDLPLASAPCVEFVRRGASAANTAQGKCLLTFLAVPHHTDTSPSPAPDCYMVSAALLAHALCVLAPEIPLEGVQH